MTAVQAILVGTFHQDIHVAAPAPPAPPPPAHVPKSYTVSGAGAGSWNGLYTLDHEHADSDSVQGSTLVWTQSTDKKHQLYWAREEAQGAWRLAIRGQAVYYLGEGGQGGGLPPLTGWQVEGAGKAPPPTLIAD